LLNEIYRTENPLTFEDLLARLLGEIEKRIRNGSLTERGLARLTNMSQPHVHHILKGKRGITPKVADRFLRVMGMDASDLLISTDDVPVRVEGETCLLAPVLEGSAGPGLPAPKVTSRSLYFPFPAALLKAPAGPTGASWRQYAVIRAGYDALLERFAEEHDLLIVSLLFRRPVDSEAKAFRGRHVMLWEYEGQFGFSMRFPESVSGTEPGKQAGREAEDGEAEGGDGEGGEVRSGEMVRLLERRRLLHDKGKPVAIVHWLLRRMHVGILWTRG
jgi:AraC-like DNA-binding protein